MAKTPDEIRAEMAARKAERSEPPIAPVPPTSTNGAAAPGHGPTAESRQPFHMEHYSEEAPGRAIVPFRRERQPEPQKELPHSTDAEQGVLGCMIRAPAFSVPIVTQRIGPSHFYSPNHQLIFADLVNAVTDLGLEGAQSLDLVVLEDYFKGVGHLEKIGGPVILRSLFVDAADPAILSHHIAILIEAHQRRELIQSSADIVRRASDEREDVGALVVVARERAEWVSTLSVARKTGLTVRTPNELIGMTFDEKDNYFGDRVLAAGQACTLLGPGGIGKSRLSMQLAVCMITGRDFLDMPTRGLGMKWLFVQTENNNRRLHFDLKNMVAALVLTPDETAEVNRLLFIHTLENDLDSFLNLINPDNYAAIHALIQDVKPKFIEWDPLNSLTDNDLNSDMDMRAVVSQISRITRHGDPDRVPLVLHHSLTGKVGAARAVGWDKASYGRNSKVLQAWTRAQINLAPRSPDDTDLLIMSCGKNNNGKAFPEIGVKFDSDKGIYLKDDSFDAAEFREEVGLGSSSGQYKSRYNAQMLLSELSILDGLKQVSLRKRMDEKYGMPKSNFYRFARELHDKNLITEKDGMWFKKGKQ